MAAVTLPEPRSAVRSRHHRERYRYQPHKATWRSGYAAVCKTVYPSSILGVASNLFNDLDKIRFGRIKLGDPLVTQAPECEAPDGIVYVVTRQTSTVEVDV